MATVQNSIESAFYFKQKKHIRIAIPHEAMHDACCKKTKKISHNHVYYWT